MCTVYGFLFYFPFQNGLETKPDYESYVQESSDSNEEITKDTTNDRMIQVYWQNRLVPESLLSQLPFFPSSHGNTNTSKYEVAKQWKNRIGGFLFFDWNFRHISNNKLKILVEPNLNTWLNKQEIKSKTLMVPKNAQSEFLS